MLSVGSQSGMQIGRPLIRIDYLTIYLYIIAERIFNNIIFPSLISVSRLFAFEPK